jgi:hypothetical protein
MSVRKPFSTKNVFGGLTRLSRALVRGKDLSGSPPAWCNEFEYFRNKLDLQVGNVSAARNSRTEGSRAVFDVERPDRQAWKHISRKLEKCSLVGRMLKRE